MFAIPCVIGNTTFPRAMLDLGASINVIPYSLYESLKLGTLHETGVVIQLADRSNAYPKGIVEDVFVKVDKLIFPADFYVLDMEHDKHATPILLGRPFLKTARTKIDVHSGCLTMEFDGSLVEFNIYDSMKFPRDDHSCYSIDVIDSYSQDVFDIGGEDSLQVALEHSLEGNDVKYVLSANLQETVQALEEHVTFPLVPSFVGPLPLTIPPGKLLPSILQAPVVELKSLPEHLKYAFLGDGDTLPVIISSKLSQEQERKLIEKKEVGIVIKEFVSMKMSSVIPTVHGKGKGKALVYASAPQYGIVSDSDDDTENMAVPPMLPSSGAFQAALLDVSSKDVGEGVGCDFAPSNGTDIELSPIPLQVVYPGEFYQGNQFGPLVQLDEQQFGGYSIFESDVDNDTMILHDDDKICEAFPVQHESSFHSIDSASSIVRHISALGVEQDPPMEPTSLSSAAKRRKGNSEDDSASSGLKRAKP
ncbi:hypothetical protein BVRB_4g095000 [Beta vulgaris subsp. vulgaris]|uniref:Uncharacterized protein n=1 Tax=Beta vulgaris subsp. vulgaris TaxID=3555 RepID=A0A0J8BDY1_BETVV|nr:hypothetical protein BVRB_4g095000 [Beta vulgaris subsp. vulgaris]